MANLEVIALDTATPQLKAPQAGDGYAMPRPVTVTEVVGSTALTLTGATQTTAVPLLNATQTWNNAAVTFTGLKFNATDTASNAASLLMDLQVGGTSKFNVRKDGQISLKAGANSGDISVDGAGRILISSSSTAGVRIVGNLLLGSTDLALERDAANTFAQRNGTNAQTFNVYNTYTSSTSYERGFLKWNTNVLQIGTEKGSGGGSARDLALQTDAITRLTVSASGVQSAAGIDFISQGGLTFASGYELRCTSRLRVSSPVDGNLLVTNWATGDFGRLQFGGTTSSFPSIKRSTTTLQVRLADDSAYASLEASTVRTATAYTVATLPAAGTAGRKAYVTDATAPTFLGALIGGGTVVCPVFDNGTAWVAG